MSLEKLEEEICEVIGKIIDCQDRGEPWGNLKKKLTSLKRLYLQQLKNKIDKEREEVLKLADEIADKKEKQRTKKKFELLFLFFMFNDLSKNSAMRLYSIFLKNDAIADAPQPKI